MVASLLISHGSIEESDKESSGWRNEFNKASAVEDAADGTYKDLPYYAVAQAAFALIYAHKRIGIIPDGMLDLGRADDSSVVRAVLIQHESAFAIYAGKQNIDWALITSQP